MKTERPNTFVTIPIREYEQLIQMCEDLQLGKKYFIWEGCGNNGKGISGLDHDDMVEFLVKENDLLQQEYLKKDIELFKERDKSLWKRIFKIPA